MIKKVKNIFSLYKKTRVLIIAHILISIIFVYSAYRILLNREMYNILGRNGVILFIVSTIMLSANIVIALKKKIPLEKIFLLIIIPIGLGFTFLQLPNLKPDEPHHLYRAYDIVNGNLYPKKNIETNISEIDLPVGYREQLYTISYQNINTNIFKKVDYNNTTPEFSTAAAYSLVTYIPTAIVLFVCKVFSVSAVLAVFMARLLNLFITIIIGYYIIKKTPIGKVLFFVLMLNPMFLHQATAINTDALINILSFAYIAYILFLRFESKKVTVKTLLILSTILTIITLGKIVYFPLVLMLLLIPRKKIVNRKNIISLVILIILNMVLILLSQMVQYEQPDIYQSSTMSMKDVALETIKNPLNYIRVVFNTIEEKGFEYITTFAGRYQNWYDREWKSPAVIIYLILVSWVVVCDRNNNDINTNISKKEKIILLGVIFIIINMIFFAFYSTYDLSREKYLFGIQGRYFIPIVPIILFALYPNKKGDNLKNYLYYYIPLLAYCNLSAILNIVK